MARSDVESLVRFCEEKLRSLEARAQRRHLVETVRLPGGRIRRGARELCDLSSNDSLGLCFHPAVLAAMSGAGERFGTGAGASRLVSGNHPLFATLERRLAHHKGAEAALVVSSGYLANLGLLPALACAADTVVLDERAHACLHAGARLTGAEVILVAHNDVMAAEAALLTASSRGGRTLLVTESVFSMDGDRAPLPALAALCRAHDAWLIVDDAHGFLVSPDSPTTCDDATVVTGSLSKASASVGGYVAGPQALIELLCSRARPLVYSTGLPPAAVAAATAALDVVDTMGSELMRAPRERAARFCADLDLPPPESHIVPLLAGGDDDERAALRLMEELIDEGFLAVAIRPPTVPRGTSRLRLSFSAAHNDEQLARLAAAVRRRWRRGQP